MQCLCIVAILWVNVWHAYGITPVIGRLKAIELLTEFVTRSKRRGHFNRVMMVLSSTTSFINYSRVFLFYMPTTISPVSCFF